MDEFYTVYRITNHFNKKTYIGAHKTKNPNDSYFGSGRLICAAIEKYGKENFTKEIIASFDNPAEMYSLEAELVNEEYIATRQTYNLCIGGEGGLGPGRVGGAAFKKLVETDEAFKKEAVLNARLGGIAFSNRLQADIKFREEVVPKLKENLTKGRAARKKRFDDNPDLKESWSTKISETLTGRSLSNETKVRMKAAHKGKRSGENNNAFGKILINNGIENKQINKDLPIPEGWVKGRLFKHQLL